MFNLHFQGMGDFDVNEESIDDSGFHITNGTWWTSSFLRHANGGSERGPSFISFGYDCGSCPAGPQSFPGMVLTGAGLRTHNVRAIRRF